jgi:predicted Kef-type K+ transport protein
MARAIARVLKLLVGALLIFGLGLQPWRGHYSMADLFGLWGWALTVAFVALAIAVLPILDTVLKKIGG